MLWREVEGKQPCRKRFKVNAINLKMEFVTQT